MVVYKTGVCANCKQVGLLKYNQQTFCTTSAAPFNCKAAGERAA